MGLKSIFRPVTATVRLVRLRLTAGKVLGLLDAGKDDWETRQREGTTHDAHYTRQAWWNNVLTATKELVDQLPIPLTIKESAMLRSWKTTVAGASTLLAIAVKVLVNGEPLTATDWAAITAAIGLIFAKDSSVSGPPK